MTSDPQSQGARRREAAGPGGAEPPSSEPAASNARETDSPASLCLNCTMPLVGPFCHGCGQRNLGPRLQVRQLRAEALSYLTQWDGQLLRTVLGLSRRPARVCLDYISGKRVRYVNPFKYCLTATALFFLWAAIGGVDPTEVVAQELAPTNKEVFVGEVRGFLLRHVSTVIFLALPIFAWMLRAIYRRSGRTFTDCYVFALFVIGHAFLIGLVLSTVGFFLPAEAMMGSRLFVQFAFLAWAAIGFFGEPPVRSVMKALVAQLCYMMTVFVMMFLFAIPFVIWGVSTGALQMGGSSP